MTVKRTRRWMYNLWNIQAGRTNPAVIQYVNNCSENTINNHLHQRFPVWVAEICRCAPNLRLPVAVGFVSPSLLLSDFGFSDRNHLPPGNNCSDIKLPLGTDIYSCLRIGFHHSPDNWKFIPPQVGKYHSDVLCYGSHRAAVSTDHEQAG